MRSHYSIEINQNIVEQLVSICGWVQRKRHLGKIIFLDVRDITGLVQVIIDPNNKELLLANNIKHEYVVNVEGRVRSRPKNQINSNLDSGAVEIFASKLFIINSSIDMPFPIHDNNDVCEKVRLKYRYIDLRRHSMQDSIIKRFHITRIIRNYLNSKGFLDIETPFLTHSTPEGARDYLVPSRNYHNKFYALPQSPQLFKQLLMISGFDRYYQIVKCFRNEDLRSDRQPEFTQIDIEASFVNEKIMMDLAENIIFKVFKEVINTTLDRPFPVLSYNEAMHKYGSDSPDLRIPLYFVDIKHCFEYEKSSLLFNIIGNINYAIAMRLSSSVIRNLTNTVIENDILNLNKNNAVDNHVFYFKVNNMSQDKNSFQSCIVKNISKSTLLNIVKITHSKIDDIIFFGIGSNFSIYRIMGNIRNKLGLKLNLYDKIWSPVWINNFPMFEKIENKLYAMQHPFAAPYQCNIKDLISNPTKFFSKSYDIIINGCEIGGGSMRIHCFDLQYTVFSLLGMSKIDIYKKFGFLLHALKCGAPNHGGIALGLDRLSMIILNKSNIRDVIAFPKTHNASCLLTGSPHIVIES